MFLLDTDTWTHLQRGAPRVVQAIRSVPDRNIGVTIVTFIEVLRGRFDAVLKAASASELMRAQVNLTGDLDALNGTEVVVIDERVSVVFDSLRVTKGLRRIGRGDLLIASIALAHRAVLVTRNLRHFRQVPNLKLANWVD
jgi:tRNA(fMet)-specific endonuclease VapC